MEKKEINLIQIVILLWKRKLSIITFVFILTIVSIGVSLILPKWYKASSVILPPTQQSDVFSMMGGMQSIGFSQMFGGNADQFRILSIIKSRTLKEQVVKKFNLVNRYRSRYLIDAIETLGSNMDVGVGEELQIYIHIWDKNQFLVADMANYILFCIDSININIASSKATSTRDFLEERLSIILDSLYRLEEKLQQFMSDEEILSLEDQVRVGVENAAMLKYEIIMAEVELEVARHNYSADSPQIEMLEVKLRSLRSKYNDMIGGQEGDFFPDYSKIPELGIRMIEIERRIEYYKTILEFLGPQYEKAKIDEHKDIPTIDILERPVVPEKKDKPRRALIVIIVFLLSSIGISVYYTIMDYSKYTNP